MDDIDNYFKRLTAAEFDEHEQVETELNALVREGFTERASFAFVTTVAAIRKIAPAATVEGVFDQALIFGLDGLLSRLREEAQPANQPAPEPKRRPKRSAARLVT
jgi:hypothetical protein